MDIQALRERVDLAAQQEQQAASLDRWLEQRLPSLHPTIAAKDSPRHSLLRFIDGYIRQVPDMLEAAQRVAEQADMRSQLRPVLKVAEAFFLQPPDLPADHSGMLALLDEAYLAHLLIEEVNDRYAAHGGGSLLPLDTTRANLIAHHLLGEPFANELDALVLRAVDGLLPASLFTSQHFADHCAAQQAEGAGKIWAQWPCLSRQLGLDIQLPGLTT